MSVIGKVVTRHFRLHLRYPTLTRKQKVYSVFSRNLSGFNCLPRKPRIHQVPLVVNRNFSLNTMKAKAMGALSPLDPSSYSRPEFAVIKHINLTYDVDFQNKILYGNALYNIKVLDYLDDLIFDTSDLSIESLELDDGTPLAYKLDEPVQNLGSKLTITLPLAVTPEKDFSPFDKRNMTKKECEQAVKDDPTEKIPMTFNGFAYKPRTPCYYTYDVEESSCERLDVEEISESCIQLKMVQNPLENFLKSNNMLAIRIKFSSAPTATGLQWLEPNQTAGKEHPYLFSQCQPIHARSIIPCQDTPAVKFTYQAEVTAPDQFTVLMSALRTKGEGNRTTFDQPVPIPSYLLAIAVGVLEHRTLGYRSIVWAEKEEIENAAWEFEETEKYLKAAEQLCGPYQWKQYDLLVLPPSFPYGGMENPCLTFVTPTLLAGDRSQADVIVHEIMHSWTGNLVTNRNFEHFWLNEGFTVFLERKVAASLQKDSKSAEQTRDFSSLLGLQELDETINKELGDDSPFTRLIINLDGHSPDDAFSRVPYEKGSLFLRYLEDLVGGPDVFDGFIRSYLNKFQRQSIDTFQFKDHFLEYFKDNEKISTIDWDTWLYKPGMPSLCFCDSFDRSMTDSVQVVVGKVNDVECTILNYTDVRRFSPQQLIYLLQTLIEQEPLSLERLRDVGETYRIDGNRNSEIEFRWLRLCVRSKDETKLDDALQFVNKQGRMKYVRPLYRDLYAWEEVRERVIANFLKNEPFMMHVTAYMLKKDLHLSE